MLKSRLFGCGHVLAIMNGLLDTFPVRTLYYLAYIIITHVAILLCSYTTFRTGLMFFFFSIYICIIVFFQRLHNNIHCICILMCIMYSVPILQCLWILCMYLFIDAHVNTSVLLLNIFSNTQGVRIPRKQK